MTQHKEKVLPIGVLILMAFVPFIAITSELMPSGVLPQMSVSYGVDLTAAAQIVGIYAISAAVLTLPVIYKTMHWDRKTHLLVFLVLFTFSTIAVGLTTNFYLALVWRLIGGLAAGNLWTSITAYGIKIVHEDLAGTATALILAGTPLGISLGIPLLTFIGLNFNWQFSFLGLAGFTIILTILAWFFLPSVPGEVTEGGVKVLDYFKQPRLVVVHGMTLFTIVAHYTVFVYIVNLVETVQYHGSLEKAQLLFGIGSILAVIVITIFIDSHFKQLMAVSIVMGAISMGLFLVVRQPLLLDFAFVFWGMTFSAPGTVFLTAAARQVTEGKDVAIAAFQTIFNSSIMIASWIGGVLLTSFSMTFVIGFAVTCLVITFVIAAANIKKLE